MGDAGRQFFSIKRTMRFGRKVLYLLLFHQKWGPIQLSLIFLILISRGLARCVVWLVGAHTIPAQSSRAILGICLTNSSKGTVATLPISGSMALRGPHQNAVRSWAMLWQKVLPCGRK